MQPKQLLIKSLDARRQQYRDDFNRARADFSEDAVHDLRVATRRLLALLALLRFLLPDLPLRPLRHDLKGQLDSLDRLRDTQVMLGELRGHAEGIPSLAPFQIYLENQERRTLARVGKSFGAIKFVAVSRLNSELLGLSEQLRGEGAVGDPVTAADQAFAVVTQRYAAVDPAQPASMHHLRVAFKSFRYTVEIVHRLVAQFPRPNLKSMDAYQTALGRIQDADVMLSALGAFAAHDESFDPGPGRSYYEQRRAEVIAAALSGLGEVQSFWRTSPDRAFPWEHS